MHSSVFHIQKVRSSCLKIFYYRIQYVNFNVTSDSWGPVRIFKIIVADFTVLRCLLFYNKASYFESSAIQRF